MSGEKDWADRIALDLCMAYEPRKPGMAKAISGFLRAERARWSDFAGADGEPRRVLGDIVVIASGEILGYDKYGDPPNLSHPSYPYAAGWRSTDLITHDDKSDKVVRVHEFSRDTEYGYVPVTDCYSTEAAALAAKESQR